MPSIASLAHSIGVSARTMVKAVARLKKAGIIEGAERERLRVAGGPSAVIPSIEQAVWRVKRAALEQDILAGIYARSNRLPSQKELCARYGVCCETMRKILRSLAADNVVFLRRKVYELPGNPARSSGKRIVFFTLQIRSMPLSALNQGQYRVFDLIESECISRELRMEIVELDYRSLAAGVRAASNGAAKATLGYILDLSWKTTQEYGPMHVELLTQIARLKGPVAVIDENGDFVLPLQFSSNPLIQVFRIEGRRAGSRVARFLLGMSHRSVAYISTEHNSFWSRQRLAGVEEEYSRAGCPAGVRPIVTQEMESNTEGILAISDFDSILIRKVLAMDQNATNVDESYRAFLTLQKHFAFEQFSAEDVRDVRSRLAIIRDLQKRDPEKQLFDQICFDVLWHIGLRLHARACARLFDRALRLRPNVTAWICASDSLALNALSYLKNRNIEVPQKLSVVGFDNQPIVALDHRLTSLDFNVRGFAYRILNFISRPPKPRGHYHHLPIEVEGIIVQRDSTGRANE
jgi:DNA-binding LacI/PurR family transcriptional regulator/DNA-binding transcriptional regulator YhcF (GntR family)